MNTEDHNDPVWELLGKARKTEASPAFVRNVLREVKALDSEPEGSAKRENVVRGIFGGSQVRGFLSIAAAVALLVVAGIALFNDRNSGAGDGFAGGSEPGENPAESVETDFLTDIDGSISDQIGEIEYVDDLLAVQDPLLLSDADIAMLLY